MKICGENSVYSEITRASPGYVWTEQSVITEMDATETLLIRGKSRTIRRIQSIHYLDRKDPDIQLHIL